ncbi:MAG: hypothetical protein E7020_01210 [Alphaproteobacteria bacterium]|nr:hypothetical protein [Alphaproteobacteria bacterium]
MMKKFIALLAITLMASNANAFDLASMANKVQSAADKASAKIEEAQAKKDAKNEEAQNKIEEKIAELKDKIAKWQASDNASSEGTVKAIADAKASIEKLTEQLKSLKAAAGY